MWRQPRDSQRPYISEGPFPSPSASAEISDEATGSLTAHSVASDYEIHRPPSGGRPDVSSPFRCSNPASLTRPSTTQTPRELAYRNIDRSQSVSSISTDTSHSQPVRLGQPAWSPSTSSGPSSETHSSSRITRQGEVWIASKEGGASSPTSQTPAPRKRGRPRKDPSAATPEPKKETKNRTKTGCITCRKRKKKCTEERPICSSCQKNNYACVYPEKEVYKTGKEKADERKS